MSWMLRVGALALAFAACTEDEPPKVGHDAGSPMHDTGSADSGPPADDAGPPSSCTDAIRHTARNLWGPLLVTCRGCHNDFGLAVERGTWQLRWDADPASLAINVAVLQGFGRAQVSAQDDRSLLLAMVSDSIDGRPHPGGALITPGTPTYAALERLINGPFESCEGSPADSLFDGVQPLPAWKLLYKAQHILTGHTPTLATIEAFEAGGADISAALDALMDGDAFLNWVKVTYKDLLLTDGPLGIGGRSIVYTAHLRKEEYPNRFYFYNEGHPGSYRCCDMSNPRGCAAESRGCCGIDDDASADFCNAGDVRIATDLSHEPFELIAHVVRNRLPLTEILTADYTMVNPFTAQVYDVARHTPEVRFDDPMNGNDWKPARLFSQQSFGGYPAPNAVPHAGIISSHAFMNRYRTGPTNLNRHRTRTFFERFMGIEIGELLEFTVNADDVLPHNPTMDGRTCRTCHAAMDPIAGAFRDWDHVGRFNHVQFWDLCGITDSHPRHNDRLCVRRTGFKGEILDETDTATVDNALAWMMQRVALDRRFALRTVQTLLEGLTGIIGIKVPRNPAASDYDAHLLAYLRQQQDLAVWADQLIDEGYQIRPVIKSIITSPWFNAAGLTSNDATRAEALQFAQIGGHKAITPERLHTRIIDVTGFPWRVNTRLRGDNWLLKGTAFRVLYGGIDGATVLKRTREPFPVMAATARRLANEMSCMAVAQDFAYNDRTARKLFRHVDVDMEPEDDDGAIDEAAFRANLIHLHYHILGERLSADDPEIDASYALLREVWRIGVNSNQPQLHERCRARRDFYTNQLFGAERSTINRDDRYVMRSWMAVISYMLSDAAFLLE